MPSGEGGIRQSDTIYHDMLGVVASVFVVRRRGHALSSERRRLGAGHKSPVLVAGRFWPGQTAVVPEADRLLGWRICEDERRGRRGVCD